MKILVIDKSSDSAVIEVVRGCRHHNTSVVEIDMSRMINNELVEGTQMAYQCLDCHEYLEFENDYDERIYDAD